MNTEKPDLKRQWAHFHWRILDWSWLYYRGHSALRNTPENYARRLNEATLIGFHWTTADKIVSRRIPIVLLELVCNLLALSFPAEFEILVVSCRASTSTNAMDGFVCQPKMFVVLAALLVGSYSVTCKAEGMDSFGRAPTLATENVTRPELSVQGTYSIG